LCCAGGQYSSWSGDIRTSFKAVLVELISSTAGRKQETVKVQERFIVKPAEDRFVPARYVSVDD